LESPDLVGRKAHAGDRRIREAAITSRGKEMTLAVDRARERIGRRFFKAWDPHDIDQLVRLTRRFAEAIRSSMSNRLGGKT
jgi:DNA-binding MarR family transcriptional regulator